MSYTLHIGDCREVLRGLPDGSVDSIVTDGPYGLSREPDMAEVLRHWLAGDDFKHSGSGFMGKGWDSFVPGPAVWREAFRVLKPGGHVLAFSGTRTYDIAVLAMRLAGFEIRDQLAWVYASGMPKSLNVAKAIESGSGRPEDIRRMAMGDDYQPSGRGRLNYDHGSGSAMNGSRGAWEPQTEVGQAWQGWGTALKPSWEPIVMARKPLIGTVATNVLAHGTGGLNVAGCAIQVTDAAYARNCSGDRGHAGTRTGDETGATNMRTGGGKAREGRWPANILHDGSDEVLAHFPHTESGQQAAGGHVRNADKFRTAYGLFKGQKVEGDVLYGDAGSAARFFYAAKASTAEREAGLDGLPDRVLARGTGARKAEERGEDYEGRKGGFNRVQQRKNHHPTVKPIAVMRWLQRLVTPAGGTTLDLYAGSGTSGMAAILEGFHSILIEMDRDDAGEPLGYEPIIRARCAWAIQEREREARAAEEARRKAAFQAAQGGLFQEAA